MNASSLSGVRREGFRSKRPEKNVLLPRNRYSVLFITSYENIIICRLIFPQDLASNICFVNHQTHLLFFL